MRREALRILPTLAGVLLVGAEGFNRDGGPWEPCACQAWAGTGCEGGAQLVALDRCTPYWLIVTGEAVPNRMEPVSRERVEVIGRFLPADADLDGFVTVADAALFLAGPWDFNGDGATDGLDVAAYLAEHQRPACFGLGARR